MKITLPRLLSVALPLGAFSSLALATQSDEKLVPAYPPTSGRTTAAATAAPSSGSTQPLIATCLPAIKDQSGAGCIQASSVPTFGDLLPLSNYFNVTPAAQVGIGTASPQGTLHLLSQVGDAETIEDGPDGSVHRYREGGLGTWNISAGFDSYAISRHNIDYPFVIEHASGNTFMNPGAGVVSIGTTTPIPGFKVDVNGAMLGRGGALFYGLPGGPIGNGTALGLAAGSTPGWNFNLDESGAPGLYLSEVNVSTNNLVLRRGGNVGIGTSFPQQRLDVAGNVRCVSLIQTSAREFKQDIAPLTGALDSILKLQGVTYSWNDKAPEAVQGHEDIGFIADDVDAVLPEIVSKDEDGKVLGLDYGKITPVAVEAIKELNAKNVELSAKNVALEARLARLEALFAGQTK